MKKQKVLDVLFNLDCFLEDYIVDIKEGVSLKGEYSYCIPLIGWVRVG